LLIHEQRMISKKWDCIWDQLRIVHP